MYVYPSFLRKLMVDNDISIEEVAKRTKRKTTTVHDWINGTRPIPVSVIYKIMPKLKAIPIQIHHGP